MWGIVGKFEFKFTLMVLSLEMKGCVLLKDHNLSEESLRSLYIPCPSLHFGGNCHSSSFCIYSSYCLSLIFL
ncbi:unnamed protein product [Camellia sinensis]